MTRVEQLEHTIAELRREILIKDAEIRGLLAAVAALSADRSNTHDE